MWDLYNKCDKKTDFLKYKCAYQNWLLLAKITYEVLFTEIDRW